MEKQIELNHSINECVLRTIKLQQFCNCFVCCHSSHSFFYNLVHVQVFTLPKVSAKMKLKLTALDGSRVRRAGVAWFGSSRSEDYCESGLVVLTNQGDLHIVSLPNVKMQVQYPCIRREDVSGIASCVFTKHGQGKNYKHLAFGLFLCNF